MKRILLAEDQPVVMKILDYYLKKSGYEVVLCDNGNQAKLNFDQQEFNLVITDILMPEADGMELINHIRNVRSSHVPVLVLTDLISTSKEEEAHRIGATHYVRKPIDIHELMATVKFFNQTAVA